MVHGSPGCAAIMALGAGFVEEALFRSILIAELTRLTRRPALPAMAAIALTVVYLWRRDLGSNVIAHALIDLVSFAHALP